MAKDEKVIKIMELGLQRLGIASADGPANSDEVKKMIAMEAMLMTICPMTAVFKKAELLEIIRTIADMLELLGE